MTVADEIVGETGVGADLVASRRFDRLELVLICVGAQKASTTWLHRVLGAHEDVHAPRLKELDYWWRLETEGAGAKSAENIYLRRVILQELKSAFTAFSLGPVRRIARRLWEHRLRRGIRGASGVNDYVGEMFRGYGGQRIVLDFSPNYALLPASGLRRIQDCFGDRARLLFVMRDPVDRMWSLAKHQARGAASAAHDEAALKTFEAIVRDARDVGYRRSRYERTIEALEEVFPRDRIMYLFYETIREPEWSARLAAFLKLDALPNIGERRVNESKTRVSPPAALVQAARQELDATYRFVRERFGADCPAAWMQ